MKKLLEIALGIIVALGGFVDIGDLVFASQAGAKFGYQLLWALAVGVLGIIVYSEMSGRVATIAKKPVFQIVRERYGRRLGWITLTSALFLSLITCAAEVGGVALGLQLLSDLPYHLLIVLALLTLLLIVWVLPFQGIERLFGYVGLGLVTFVIAAIKLHPDWSGIAHGLVPQINHLSPWSYMYFAVGLIAAAFMPYEVYFYSSGAIEEKWKPGDMVVNRANSIIGFILGGLVVAGIIITSAMVLGPANIDPQFLGTSMLGVVSTLGSAGLILAILGAVFAIGGAAVETSFSAAYNLSQFFGWKWGKHEDQFKVPHFTLSWIILFLLAALVIITGVDPITLTEYAVIFSVVAMPLTYWPIFMLARDKKLMGKFTNKKLANVLGWVYLVIIGVVSIAALPLMIITNRGQA